MKRILVIFLFLPLFSLSQGKIEGGFYAEYFQLGDMGQQQYGGILHIPFAERFTLNYQVGIGPRQGGGFYFHAPAGVVAGGWLVFIAGFSNLDYFGFLLAAVPQGVGMYVGKGTILSHISVDPLSVDYWRRSFPFDEKWKLCCNVTYRAKMRGNFKWPIYIAPQATTTFLYLPGTLSPVGFRAGVTIGFEAREPTIDPIIPH